MSIYLRNLYQGKLFHVGQRVRNRHLLAAVGRHARPAARVLDAGSGGGCLAIAVAARHPEMQVDGIELAPEKVTQSEAEAAAALCELDYRLGSGGEGNGLLVAARRPAAGS